MKKLFSFLIIVAMIVAISMTSFAWEKVDISGAGFGTDALFQAKIIEFLEEINDDTLALDWSNLTLTIGSTIPPGGLTIGEDDSGFDVQFFGATSGAYFLWDESEDEMIISTGGTLNVIDNGGFEIASTPVTSTAAELNQLDGITGLVNVYQETVDCSGGGSGEVEELVTLPAGSVLLNVVALVTETFDGDATKSFEVGVATNYDNYIDTTDLGSTADTYVDMISGSNNDNSAVEVMTAETTIAAEWTNTASMTAGEVTVTILYY